MYFCRYSWEEKKIERQQSKLQCGKEWREKIGAQIYMRKRNICGRINENHTKLPYNRFVSSNVQHAQAIHTYSDFNGIFFVRMIDIINLACTYRSFYKLFYIFYFNEKNNNQTSSIQICNIIKNDLKSSCGQQKRAKVIEFSHYCMTSFTEKKKTKHTHTNHQKSELRKKCISMQILKANEMDAKLKIGATIH